MAKKGNKKAAIKFCGNWQILYYKFKAYEGMSRQLCGYE